MQIRVYNNIDGLIYGVTSSGGNADAGTIYSLDPNTGTRKTVYSFKTSSSADGFCPETGLTMFIDNKLYGVTTTGGDYNKGVVFSFDPITKVESVVHSFNGSEGNDAKQLYTYESSLYGATHSGGAYNKGTVFKLTFGRN